MPRCCLSTATSALAVLLVFLPSRTLSFVPIVSWPFNGSGVVSPSRRYVSQLQKTSTEEDDSLAGDILALKQSKIPRTLRTSGSDPDATVRKSHENVEVQVLYKEFLDHPLSEASEKLLHATFAPRGSPRDMLGRFLDAVDHRDGEKAASLLTDDAVWNTNTPMFGIVEGRDDIISLINSKLPPVEVRVGIEPTRHRLASAIEGTDVIMPNGEQVHFNVVLDDTTGRIKTLSRVPMCTEPMDMDG